MMRVNKALPKLVFSTSRKNPFTNTLASLQTRCLITPSLCVNNSSKAIFAMPRRFFASEGGSSDTLSERNPVEQPTYIKTMKNFQEWEDAWTNKARPVVIQASTAWCGPCTTLKPMLIDAVKAHGGKLEYLYIDIDKF